jgi:hypothetical protein
VGSEEKHLSEVARLKKQIEAEYEAAQRGLSGLAAGYSRHAFIEARLRQLGAYRLELGRLIGSEQATALVMETLEQVNSRLAEGQQQEKGSIGGMSSAGGQRAARRSLRQIREAHRIDLEGLAQAAGCTVEDLLYLEKGGVVFRDDAEKVVAALARLSGEALQLEEIEGLRIVEDSG